MATKRERLTVFFDRLAQAPSARDGAEALRLICDTMNEVEDELTDIAFDPDSWRQDGRMYPPQEDSAFDVEGHPEITRYRSRQHNTFIAAWGAIEVRTVNGEVLFRKPGADEREVWP